MKLERLEELKKISTKNVIVNEVMNSLEEKIFYTKYDIEVALGLVILAFYGDKEIHKEMDREDINWIEFIDNNMHLVDDLKTGDYKDIYDELYAEIEKLTDKMAEYNRSFSKAMDKIMAELVKNGTLDKILEEQKKTA